ncbi:MAG: GAF domain-containing sensor histidine kinase [Cyanobacteria bacterium P01_E01_bin.35]
MTKLKNQLFCRLDGLTPSQRKEQRLTTLTELGLLISEAVPLFEETIEKAAAFSEMPIGILSLAVDDELWFKAAVGLSTIGLTNQLAAQRKISLQESFSSYVIDSQQPLLIENTLSNAVFSHSVLAQHYGIKTYLGVPLISSNGICIGTLEVMHWAEKQLNNRDIDHLTLLACWCLREFERNQLRKKTPDKIINNPSSLHQQQANSLLVQQNINPQISVLPTVESKLDVVDQDKPTVSETAATNPIKLKLLSQLTQELRTPLTSVIGMASVLHREVYGPLTIKQREYLEIIHDSGQNLISLVDEIVSLGVLSDRGTELNRAATDIEMLCQQVINSLSDTVKQQQQLLRLSIEPGNRIWSLDKETIRQAIYYLIVSVLEISEPGGEVKIHVSRRNKNLNIAIGISHPWLGEDFGQTKLHSHTVTQALKLPQNAAHTMEQSNHGVNTDTLSHYQILTSSALMMAINDKNTLENNTYKIPRDILGLLLCCHLTESHHGRVVVQGSSSSSYRYLLQFPHAQLDEK